MNEKGLKVEVEISKRCSFSMHQNQVPIIYKCQIENISKEPIKDLDILISFSPEFASEYNNTIVEILPGQKIDLMPMRIIMFPQYLFEISEKILANLIIEILQEDVVIYKEYHEIEILPYDYWQGITFMPEIIAAFIMPNLPRVGEIISKASRHLQNWNKEPSFTGYQTQDINEVKLQAAAIYAALQEENIAYTMPPASFEKTGQRVRIPEYVLEKKQGTCIDLAVLFASCLEAININPILMIVKGHAFVAYWLEEKTFSDISIDDCSAIKKRITKGINQISLIECTDFVIGKNISIDTSEQHAIKKIENEEDFIVAIDIKRARESEINPMPVRIMQNGKYEVIDFADREEKDITSAPKIIDTSMKKINLEEKKMTRQQLWERKLLDMTLRNTLLSFKLSRNILQIICPDLAVLEDELSDGKEFSIMPIPIEWEFSARDSKIFEIEKEKNIIQSLVENEFKNGRIRTFLNDDNLVDIIKKLIRKAKNSMEENGTNTLYLALGFLKWFENKKSVKERYAPIIMIPVDIVKKMGNKGYVIRVRDDEPQINITLLEFLKQNYDIEISGLDPLPVDESGIDVPLILKTIRMGIMNQPRWDVSEISFIGLFSFSRFVMWNDLRNRSEELAKNKVVSSLISGKIEWKLEELVSADELDELLVPSDLAIPSSVDSSQLSAIVSASEGQSFVLHGPPGTGKSQTITNMIANSLYHGKSVLFVAEKMAALSVVYKRLSVIGLGSFCLELHSNKAQKKNVLQQFENTLEVGHIKKPDDYIETAQKIQEIRLLLNEVVNELHKKQTCGKSIYELIGIFEEKIELYELISVPEDDYSQISKQKLEDYQDIMRRFKIAYDECGYKICDFFKPIENRDFYPEYKKEIENILNKYDDILTNSNSAIEKIKDLFGISYSINIFEYQCIYKVIDKLSKYQRILGQLVCNNEFDILAERIVRLVDNGKQMKNLKGEILSEFDTSVFSYDIQTNFLHWKNADLKWFLPKTIQQSKILRAFKIYAQNPKQISKKNIKKKFEIFIQYKNLVNEISNADEYLTNIFGVLWNNHDTEWNDLTKIVNDSIELRKELDTIPQNIFLSLVSWLKKHEAELPKYKDEFLIYIKSYEKFYETEEILKEKYYIFYENEDNNWIQYRKKSCENILSNLDYLKAWISLLCIYDAAKIEGIEYACDAVLNRNVSSELLVEAFNINIIYAILSSVIGKSEVLCKFQGSQFEETIFKYKELLNEFEILTIKELVAVLSSKIPNTNIGNVNSSEIGILQKAIKSRGRGISVRKLFDSIPNLLRRLCPCMLMSPMSVAQFVDPSFPKFDLVIFDEASQLPTSEAVGAIARGKNVIVVGDPKQLPPTSFFSSSYFDDDNMDIEDLESVLDDCMAINMPQKHLLWHYRSRHESLIAYSNMKYYDNKLFTFPSPNDLSSKVKYVSVDGYYDKGKSKQNKAEAIEVVKEIVKRLGDKELRKESIGVVTFSSVQQNLIDDLLLEEFAKNHELEQINNDLSEPVFIKNLENVQGDERDVIIFSICYAPDKEGKMSMNFGPINREGGWRRLNVAITRARKEMIVVATLKPENIDLSRTKAEGVYGLKGFLEYAINGKNMFGVKNYTIKEKNILLAKIISKQINEQGYKTSFEIGSSNYRVDIGVINPVNPNEYIIGIMLDGENYQIAETSRDRNILQHSVLEGLGWRLYHIWTIDWLDSPKKEMEKLLIEIKNTVEKKDILKSDNFKVVRTEIEFEKIADNFLENEKSIEYVTCKINQLGYANEFYKIENQLVIKKLIKKIIQQEAPISHKLLTKRVIEVWGITRSGSKVDEIIIDNISKISVKKTRSQEQKFYWGKSQKPKEYMVYRRSNDDCKRAMDEICEQEVSNAIYDIMENHCSLIEDDLIRETARIFGYTKRGNIIEKSVKAGIECAIVRGFIERVAGGEKIQLKV